MIPQFQYLTLISGHVASWVSELVADALLDEEYVELVAPLDPPRLKQLKLYLYCQVFMLFTLSTCLCSYAELVADALVDEKYGELVTPLDPPRMKKLKYTDIQGYQEAMRSLALTTEDYEIPRTPALDAGQWVDTHFKEV